MEGYPLKEVFRSVQGEGPSAGCDAVFIRFAGCNLRCPFCDEDHQVMSTLDADEILDLVLKLTPDVAKFRDIRVVLTGGEPLMHLDTELLHRLLDQGFQVCAETNGSDGAYHIAPLEAMEFLAIHELVVSPKDAEPSEVILSTATSLKCLVTDTGQLVGGAHTEQAMRWFGKWRPRETRLSRFLQPVTPRPGDHTADIRTAARGAVSLARRLSQQQGVEWRVMPQTHVWMGLK